MIDPVRYALAGTPAGRLLAGATADGLCWAALGDDDDALAADLLAAYPGTLRDDACLAPLTDALAASLRGEGDASALPLDVIGTAFQRRVWDALRAIPRGQTRTYADVAASLGLPFTAARAVALAVGANPVALAIPCHRVVRTDGSPTDFRWGAGRKRTLLALEAAPSAQLTLF